MRLARRIVETRDVARVERILNKIAGNEPSVLRAAVRRRNGNFDEALAILGERHGEVERFFCQARIPYALEVEILEQPSQQKEIAASLEKLPAIEVADPVADELAYAQ